ncbi:hypothetical protein [Actinomadura sp. 6N118]|uniref:hypothetical protein n=1 Tax=Actinomadura sp. 6N118 TaxID=3375151 RepID=UPI003792DC4B
MGRGRRAQKPPETPVPADLRRPPESPPAAHELVFKPLRRNWFAMVAFTLLLSTNFVPVLFGMRVELRPWGFTVMAILLAWLFLAARKSRTVINDEGITCRQVGRPWQLSGPISIPWHDIAVVEGRRFHSTRFPVLHLKDGGVLWVRHPNGARNQSFDEQIASIQQRHLAATGMSAAEAAVPEEPARPGWRRRAAVAICCALVLALDIWLIGCTLARLGDRPPDVAACPLVPRAAAERTFSGVYPAEAENAKWICNWTRKASGVPDDETPLKLTVTGHAHEYGRNRFEEERRKNQMEHITHGIPGLRGYSWHEIKGSSTDATAILRVGDYNVTAEVTGKAKTSGPDLEQRAIEVVRLVNANLRDRS